MATKRPSNLRKRFGYRDVLLGNVAEDTYDALAATFDNVDSLDTRVTQIEEHGGGGGTVSYGSPVAIVVGGANVDGAATTLARADHKHALAAFGTGAGDFCEGDDPRLSDSRTPTTHASSHLPAGSDPLTTATAGAIQPDDAAAVGTANSFARSDHRHSIVAASPGSITPGDVAAEGVATSFARSDHVHALALEDQYLGILAAISNSGWPR